MDKRQEARKLWEASDGTLPLKEIAERLGVAEGTLRSWKKRDTWGSPRCSVAESATQRERQRKRQAQVNRKAAELIEANEELKDWEKEFCLHFVSCFNATQAAMRTGRYSNRNSADSNGHKLLQKPAVQTEIKRLKAMKRVAILADVDDLVELHMSIAFSDITDFVEFGTAEVPVMGPFGPIEVKDDETEKTIPLLKEINVVRFKESVDVDGRLISEVKQGRDGASVKLADRQKSLAFLERYFEANPMDRHKKAYDEARLRLEDRAVKVQEDKLHGLSSDVETIKEGLKDIVDIINASVPDRRLDDE